MMRSITSRLIACFVLWVAATATWSRTNTSSRPQCADEPPTEWIEAATGHRVVRLSREPASSSLYFHQYAYSADGHKLVITTPGGLSAVNLKTREIEQVVSGRAGVLVTGRKTGHIYYTREGAVHAADLGTRATREVAKVPPFAGRGGGIAVNAHETMLVGIAVDPEGVAKPRTPPPGDSGGRLGRRWAAGTPMMLYTINLKNGEVKIIHRENDWTNHLQCSPTDPNLIMFCHEGPWHFVDRIWTIRVDGTNLRKIHSRTMDMEIAGHEFFSADGKTIWYDLQTPKGKEFWLAGYEIKTGKMTKYKVEREHWSVHFNASPDGKRFAGDGGGPSSVAAPGNGQWIYRFTPKDGALQAEKLVDLSKHDYRLEPNVTFTPDGKWIVFRSNLHGPTHVYAVDVAKAK